jgi:7-keto-8-aminopelargonate synthetase-like enzyme
MISKFKNGLTELGYNVIPSDSAIIPILTGNPEPTLQLADDLRKEGVFTPAVRPPSVAPGKCRIRTSLMSLHTEHHIEKALSAFEKVR